ncbi:MAG: formyl transferase [Deltaproteobacteria bacterium]|nr:formyl transferase [Deltaproteobacteria bacterium]
MNKPKVVILVSSDPSDIYFANRLTRRLNVAAVFVEEQHGGSNLPLRLLKALRFMAHPLLLFKKISDNRIVKEHFRKTTIVDKTYFGEEGRHILPHAGQTVVYTEGGKTINEPGYIHAIQEIKPDVIAVCGTSVLQEKVLSIPPKGVLNLHGGLAQKYRGTCTTLWALFNGEPEYIGATVHYVDKGIDDGDILYQGRPEISGIDNPETLYVKVVKLGIEMMIRAIEDIENDRARSCALTEKGALYLNRMITPEVLQRVWQNIDAGILDDYLKDKTGRDKKVYSIMQNVFHT